MASSVVVLPWAWIAAMIRLRTVLETLSITGAFYGASPVKAAWSYPFT
jgi:hypothetical protein